VAPTLNSLRRLAEHQEDHPQFGKDLDGLFVMDQAEWRGVRADDEAGDNVAQHHRLLEAVKNYGDHASDHHDDCQVLDEADGMHGVILLFSSFYGCLGRPLLCQGKPERAASTYCIECRKAHGAWAYSG